MTELADLIRELSARTGQINAELAAGRDEHALFLMGEAAKVGDRLESRLATDMGAYARWARGWADQLDRDGLSGAGLRGCADSIDRRLGERVAEMVGFTEAELRALDGHDECC